MSGVQGHVLGHLVRQGVDAAQQHFYGIEEQQMQEDADRYSSHPEYHIDPKELIPIFITAVIMMLLMASIRYTIGEVVASLAMIETPTTTAFIEDKPPAYADEPDAPLEKESLMPSEAEADVEVMLVDNKPITGRITATVGHLHRIGGFRARWRGLGLSILYHGLHNLVAGFFAHLVGLGLIGQAVTYIFTSVALSRLHMAWTHSMIAYPSSKPFWRRMVSRKQALPVLLPSLVFATAQQATLILPLSVMFWIADSQDAQSLIDNLNPQDCDKVLYVAAHFLAVPIVAFLVAFCVLLPATVTLTRVEAALLPEGEETIVPFDRQAIMGDVDFTVRGAHKRVFLQAWRSFDPAARWRLVKLYSKMVLIQATVFLVGVHVMVAELFLIGGERIGVLAQSLASSLQLEVIHAQQNAN